MLGRFVFGGLLLIIGLTIFLLGVDLGIQPMGERCGAELTKKRNLALLVGVAFVIGFMVTVAEPDIQVFGDQVRSVFSHVNKLSLVVIPGGRYRSCVRKSKKSAHSRNEHGSDVSGCPPLQRQKEE